MRLAAKYSSTCAAANMCQPQQTGHTARQAQRHASILIWLAWKTPAAMSVCNCCRTCAGMTFLVTKSLAWLAFAIIYCSTAAALALSRPGLRGPKQADLVRQRLTNICCQQPQMVRNNKCCSVQVAHTWPGPELASQISDARSFLSRCQGRCTKLKYVQ